VAFALANRCARERSDPPRVAPVPSASVHPEPSFPPPVERTPGAGGYGRPAPLASFQAGDGAPAPLFIDPAAPPLEPVAVPLPDAILDTSGAGATRGTLPGRWGNASAPVTLVVWDDFACPFCMRLDETLRALHQRFPTQVEQQFRDLPLDMHPGARLVHEIARCAAEQGRFWELHDRLFAAKAALPLEAVMGQAVQLGADEEALLACLGSGRAAHAVDADLAAARAAGIVGTPTVFVNGRRIDGARPLDQWVTVVEEALGSAAP
jgi:predicted DsbA family dithiol-disulfide isomerase